ncbi:MAG: DoxX family protein [Planctomycetota bacterium]
MSIATLNNAASQSTGERASEVPTVRPTAHKLVWIAQIVAAAILAMTLPFKFSGAEETVRLFDALGAGAPGRIGSAVMETIAVLMLLTPRLAALGGLLTVGIMGGAILSHIFVLGIVWDGDASLFAMAVIAFVAGATVAWLRRRELPIVGSRFE